MKALVHQRKSLVLNFSKARTKFWLSLLSIQLDGIRKFWLMGHILVWEYYDILGPKIQTRKLDKIYKDFELYQTFMYKFCAKMCRYFQKNSISKK